MRQREASINPNTGVAQEDSFVQSLDEVRAIWVSGTVEDISTIFI